MALRRLLQAGIVLLVCMASGAFIYWMGMPPTEPGVSHIREKNSAAESVNDSREEFEYLNQHNIIATHGNDWSRVVASMNENGDAFTLHLLHEIDGQTLTADEAELRLRAIEQIQERRGSDAEKLQIAEVEPMLIRTSLADLRCYRIENSMRWWLLDTLKAQLSDPDLRKELEALRDNPPVRERQRWGECSKRIVEYIDQVLNSDSVLTKDPERGGRVD